MTTGLAQSQQIHENLGRLAAFVDDAPHGPALLVKQDLVHAFLRLLEDLRIDGLFFGLQLDKDSFDCLGRQIHDWLITVPIQFVAFGAPQENVV